LQDFELKVHKVATCRRLSGRLVYRHRKLHSKESYILFAIRMRATTLLVLGAYDEECATNATRVVSLSCTMPVDSVQSFVLDLLLEAAHGEWFRV